MMSVSRICTRCEIKVSEEILKMCGKKLGVDV